jgi:GTP-binding protein HflX
LALVGYTNAGKSTLFNRLTHSEVLADRKMFATLDPTVRALLLPSRRKVLLSDTVGFIRNLPTTLVHAFQATLEEVADAALIIHVVDVSSEQAPAQTSQVFKVLGEIGVGGTPQILVLNKSDRLPVEEASLEILRQRILSESSEGAQVPAALISGLTGAGIAELLALIDEAIPSDLTSINRFRIPAGQGAEISLLHEMGKVLDVEYHDGVCEIEAAVPPNLRDKLSPYLI